MIKPIVLYKNEKKPTITLYNQILMAEIEYTFVDSLNATIKA